MASSGDASPPHRSEKRSRQTQDPAVPSQPTGCTKVSLSHDATGGRGAHARAQAQASPIGAVAQEFVPGLGDVPTIDPTEEALDQEGRTIADDVSTMTPSALGYFWDQSLDLV